MQYQFYYEAVNTGQSQIKKIFKVTKMWFYRMILRIPWIEHVSNNEVLEKVETKTTYTQDQKETVEISRAHNEESEGRKLNSHG